MVRAATFIGARIRNPKGVTVLTEHNVTSYLLDRRFLAAKAVVEGSVRVVDASQRNRTYMVIAETGPSFLLKQGVEPGAIATVAHEANVYRFLQDEANGPGLARYLPHFHDYDAEEGVLLLELLPGALNLQEYATKCGRFSTLHAKAVGRALAALHGIPEPRHLKLSRSRPWVLSLHRPTLNVMREFSGANIQLIKLVQEYGEFGEHFDELRRTWTPRSFTHSDFKWGNCVVSQRTPTGPRTRLSIVDWELAGFGDPSWDVGSVFHDYLSFWLLSIPITGEVPPDQFLALARYPLEKMRQAMRAFWLTYVERRELSATAANQLLPRATRMGGARLIQTAVEQLQMSAILTGNVVCILQLASNILKRPREASLQLLGLGPESSMAS